MRPISEVLRPFFCPVNAGGRMEQRRFQVLPNIDRSIKSFAGVHHHPPRTGRTSFNGKSIYFLVSGNNHMWWLCLTYRGWYQFDITRSFYFEESITKGNRLETSGGTKRSFISVRVPGSCRITFNTIPSPRLVPSSRPVPANPILVAELG